MEVAESWDFFRDPIELSAPYDIEVGPPPAGRAGLFGDILGDILSPIESFVQDAFNEFKGPLMDIVKFVMNNVLTGLIKFITHAVEQIFPGMPVLEGRAKSLILEVLGLLPEALANITTVADNALGILQDLPTIIDDCIALLMVEIGKAYGELKSLAQGIIREAQLGAAKIASALQGLTADAIASLNKIAQVPGAGGAPSQGNSSAFEEFDALLKDVSNMVGTIKTSVKGSMSDAARDITELSAGAIRMVLAGARELYDRAGDLLGVAVADTEALLKAAASEFAGELRSCELTVRGALEDVETEARGAARDAESIMGLALGRASKISARVQRIASSTEADALKHAEYLKGGAKRLEAEAGNILVRAEEAAMLAGLLIVVCTGVMIFLFFRDVRAYAA